MAAAIDLDAYFNRIQWGGGTAPSHATLAGLVHAHMAHIPFENLDVLLGRPVRLDLPSLQNKLVQARRGGYCFEHATLLGAVLEQLGFATERKLARVVLERPLEAAARTHMFLSVSLADGRYVVDPGFGALAPQTPLALLDVAPTLDSGATHWMQRDRHYWKMCARPRAEVIVGWVSTLEDEGPADFEMGNHHVASYPTSPFVNRIMLRALTPTGRVTVMNRDVTIWRGGEPESQVLADRQALRALLAQYFGFDLPEVAQRRVPDIAQWG